MSLKGRVNLDTHRDTRDVNAQRKYHVRIMRESDHFQTKERGLRGNKICQHPNLGLLASSTLQKLSPVV